MKKLVIFLFLSFSLFGQTGTVVRSAVTIVTSTAINPAGTSTMICTFTNPIPPSLNISCTVNGAVRLTQSVAVQISPTTGSTGSYDEANNHITWVLTQPTANVFTYDIAANGVRGTGNF